MGNGDVHGYATRLAGSGLFFCTGECRAVGYRLPKEWASLTEAQWGAALLVAFMGASRQGFLGEYGAYVCCDVKCEVCGGMG